MRSVRWSHLRPTLSLPVCACAADSLFRVATDQSGAHHRSALLCGAVAFACTLLPVGNLIRLGAAVVVGAGVYAVCIIVSGEGREEVQAVLRRLKR